MHPEARTSQSINLSAEFDDDLELLKKSAEQAIDSRASWEAGLRSQYKQRMASAPKPDPNWPWPGSANMAIPLTDKTILKKVPLYFNSVFNVSPIASMVPAKPMDPDISRRVEQFYDHLVRHKMRRSKQAVVHAVQNTLTYGLGFLKCIWDTKTERRCRAIDVNRQFGPVNRDEVPDEVLEYMADLLGLDRTQKEDRKAFESAVRQFRRGDDTVKVSLQSITYNAPLWTSVDPLDILVPWDATDDVDELPWIVHRLRLTKNQLRQRAKLGLYTEKAVEKAIETFESKGTRDHTDRGLETFRYSQYEQEGVFDLQSEKAYVELWECYHWTDVNGDGLAERCVSTVVPDCDVRLRSVEYPYYHGQWPITRLANEEREGRWYSPRGVAKMIEDLQKEINAQHNAKLDRMQIINAPTFKVKENSARAFRNARFRPGEFYRVRRMDDVEPMYNGQVQDYSFDNEHMLLKSFVEEYAGIVDFGVAGANSGVERRTAKEISFIEQNTNEIASLELSFFQDAMSRVHHQTLNLWYQYGDDETWFSVDGREPIRFDRRDLANKFEVIPVGNLGNLSSAARANTAMNLLSVASSPAMSQYANIPEMWRDFVEATADYRTAARYLRKPGDLETDAERQQISELTWMDKIGMVHPAYQYEDHATHMRVVEQAIQTAPDEETARLYYLHLVLHQFAAGSPEVSVEDIEQAGYQLVTQGARMYLVPIDDGQLEQTTDQMTAGS